MRCEVGNIVEKLDTMMARQEETKDRGKFRMKLHLSRLISDQKINYVFAWDLSIFSISLLAFNAFLRVICTWEDI